MLIMYLHAFLLDCSDKLGEYMNKIKLGPFRHGIGKTAYLGDDLSGSVVFTDEVVASLHAPVPTVYVVRNKQPRDIWKKAYRLARQPDIFLADSLVLDFPVHYLLYAMKCKGVTL